MLRHMYLALVLHIEVTRRSNVKFQNNFKTILTPIVGHESLNTEANYISRKGDVPLKPLCRKRNNVREKDG